MDRAEPAPENFKAAPAEDAREERPPEKRAGNPALKVAILVVVVIVGLVAWYAVTDRAAPYSSRGTVSAYVAELAPRVSGQVTEVLVQDNAVVEAGEPLFRLDPRPFEIAARQAEADLAQATQATSAAVASITASQARVAEARADAENVRAVTARTTELVERGVLPKAQGDTAQAELRTAEARLDTAEAELESAVRQLGEVGEANPQVQAAQLRLEQAQLDLLFATVAAPARGVVTNVGLTTGQYVSPGTPAMTFLDARGAWITADMRENQLGNVEPGDPVGVLFDAVPGRVFEGRVHSIA